MTLGERLAALRTERGWPLREVVAAIERATGHRMSPAYLGDIERNEKSPTLGRLALIAAGYGLTPQQLLAGITRFAANGYRARTDESAEEA